MKMTDVRSNSRLELARDLVSAAGQAGGIAKRGTFEKKVPQKDWLELLPLRPCVEP